MRRFCLLSALLPALLLAAAAAPAPARAQPAAALSVQVSRAVPGELRGGDVLVLSAGTLKYAGSHPSNATITSADGCRDACMALPGCNAWTFCGNGTAGCGSGCKSHSKRNPKMGAVGISSVSQALPVTRFGPWTFPQSNPDGCHPVTISDAAVTTSDAWPFGMCTLKRLAPGVDGLKQAPTAEDRASGWVSGTVAAPAAPCAGLPAAACAACLASKSPSECLQCARDKRAALKADTDYVVRGGSDAMRGCAICAGGAAAAGRALRDACFDCVLSGKPCAQCALGSTIFGTGPADVAGCLACARRKPALAGACNECAQSKAPARCFACLEGRYNLRMCPAPAAPGVPSTPSAPAAAAAPGACRQPTASTPCARCANSVASDATFGRCLACFSDPNRDSECASCGEAAESDADRERCYACVGAAGFTSNQQYGCSACFGGFIDGPDAREACLACAEARATPGDAKRWCASCADGEAGRAGARERSSCVACLQSEAKRSGGGNVEAVCLAKGGPGPGGRRRLLVSGGALGSPFYRGY